MARSTTTAEAAPPGATPREVALDVSGMTCGSCATRVERVLGRHPGVARAAVNFATGRAVVDLDDLGSVDELVSAVARIGYGASPATPPAEGDPNPDDAARRVWVRRLLVAWPLGIAVFVLGMWFMHDRWARWLAFALATPVQLWAGLPFLRSAATRARARTANMDTLIAMGTLTAYLFSAYQVVFGPLHADHYFDTAALIIAFLLLGRYFEARRQGPGLASAASAAGAGRQGRPRRPRRRGTHGPRRGRPRR